MDYLQPKFYRFSEDSLWLASVASVSVDKSGSDPESLIDLGAGCGVVGIESANKISSVRRLCLLEPQKEFMPFLKGNLRLLRSGVKVEVLNCPAREGLGSEELFDLAVSNPPYFKAGSGRISPSASRERCRTFGDEDLLSFLEIMFLFLGEKGQGFALARKSNPDFAKLARIFGKRIQIAAETDKTALLFLAGGTSD